MVVGNKTSFQNNPIARQGETATRTRTTSTEDTMGGTISSTTADEEVTLVVGNITVKDLKIHEMGLAVPGNLKIYFDVDQDIIEGDLITRANGIKWRVEKITAEYPEVYKIGVMRNVDLTGSS